MKNIWKRFLSLVLCVCMVWSLLPNVTMTAFAASSGEVTGLSNENIGLSYSGDKTDTWTASGTTVSGSMSGSIFSVISWTSSLARSALSFSSLLRSFWCH